MGEHEIKRHWGPGHLVQTFMNGETWINSDGKAMAVATMPVPYALNVILYLERCRGEIEQYLDGVELQKTPLYVALKTRSLAGADAPYTDKEGARRRHTETLEERVSDMNINRG